MLPQPAQMSTTKIGVNRIGQNRSAISCQGLDDFSYGFQLSSSSRALLGLFRRLVVPGKAAEQGQDTSSDN
jgi:hypothetical protein